MKPQDRMVLEAKPRTLTKRIPAPIVVVVNRGTMKTYEMVWVPGYATALAERHGIETEEKGKLCRHIGARISDFVRKHRPGRWSFAAASEINPGILEHVAPEWRERLTRNIKSDLAKIPVGSLLQHLG